MRHKKELRAMVEEELSKKQHEEDAHPVEAVTSKHETYEARLEEEALLNARNEENEIEEELQGEMHTARKFYQEKSKKKRKEQVASTKIKTNNFFIEPLLLKFGLPPPSLVPPTATQLFMCKMCQKLHQREDFVDEQTGQAANVVSENAAANIPPLELNANELPLPNLAKNISDFFKKPERDSAHNDTNDVAAPKRGDETYRKSDTFDGLFSSPCLL
jgi:hypothetical protein